MEITNDEYLRIRNAEIRRLEKTYDFNSVKGIQAIPVPCNEVNGSSPTGRVEYYLRGLCFYNHWSSGRKEIAIECLKKAQELMYVSDMIWKYEDFIKLVSYLHTVGRHEEAREEERRVDLYFEKNGLFPNEPFWRYENIFSYFRHRKLLKHLKKEHERKRILRHEYYWMQENIPESCPKSISAWSRMKNSKSPKYKILEKLAEEKGFHFN